MVPMKPYGAILKLLAETGVPYEEISHEPVFTSEQAAAIRGMKLEQGAKSLLLKTKEGAFVLCVLPGHKRADSKKLKALLGTKSIRFATPEEVIEHMGCEIGACYPFGNVAGLRTLVDESLGQNDIISFNPGRHDVSIKMRYADYIGLVNAEVVNLTTIP